MRGVGVNNTDLLVAQPSAITGIARLIRATPLSVLKDQLMIRSLDGYAAYLPSAFDKEAFSFYGTVLSGTPQQEERWKRAVNFTTGTLADQVSQIYVQRFFPPETKAAADELVKNVVAAMGRRIDNLTWMAPETKARARAKLANFTTKIGYPDQWRDYSALEVRSDDLIGNAMRSAEFEHLYQVGKLGGPVRKWEWGMTPMTINAYANFGMMEIVFPAAILQPPFFDPNADPALNYGGIGAVIGHEISHHFDDQGAKYDEHGRLSDWWTPADVKAFEAAGKSLIAQYDAYEIFPGAKLKGDFTLGENIGDLAGLTVAYDAYRHSLGGKAAPVIEGTTGDQRFYLGWAQVWRRNYREANLRQRLITDPHSPSEQRVAVVRNLDPWYDAFSVQPGQKLYLTPAERVRIW
jgi:putative endopeptidase